ncbi:ADP-ribosylglycohydrolase family protein [Plantibacter sp. YIM 135249]|uniref:ADP-ribosylglycohydrolase family protein n=1 Tax=Plantibacter sp. YIM 135249 TaxID=3423918 RepID=UPI003D334447
MLKLDLRGSTYTDKLLGCWMGKNAGGTLGAPLEEGWGRDEPFDIDWYPKLETGGIPNDDLEMQLIWLAALKQVGPGLTARDLAPYWLDHIGYNWDEYGLSKANLRLGLVPPVSGSFNNWFLHCMGSPIRSELWACVAPGHPRIAARYAYEDAICDHAGGEGVYGELFNVAMQAAAFVVDDHEQLLDIGLSYVPEDSQTARAVRAARDAHRAGLTWQEARKRVIATSEVRIAQYSPFNIGFQVVGLLYGADFGDAICTTVNCGYDTDSSGASIGSLWGIIAGQSRLPQKWIEPFGIEIATNEDWHGVRHMSDGSTPIPETLPELIDDLRVETDRVLAHHGVTPAGGVVEVSLESLYADDSIRELWTRSVTEVRYDFPEYSVTVDYGGDPIIAPGRTITVVATVHNPHPDAVTGSLRWILPEGWPAVAVERFQIAASASVSLDIAITAPDQPVDDRNVLYLAAELDEYPAEPAVPFVLVGAPLWELAEAPAESDGTAYPNVDELDWERLYGSGNRSPLHTLSGRGGRVYLRTFLQSPVDELVRVGVDSTVPNTVWLDGVQIDQANQTIEPKLLRPNFSARYSAYELTAGWHEVLVEFTLDGDDGLADAYLLLASADRLVTPNVAIGRTRVPVPVEALVSAER